MVNNPTQTSTQACAAAIPLKQLVSMLQLQLSQPHVLAAIITSKRCQVLNLTITNTMPFNFPNFVFAFTVDFNRRHVSVHPVVLPVA